MRGVLVVILPLLGCDYVFALEPRADASPVDAAVGCGGTSLLRADFTNELELAQGWDKVVASSALVIEIVERTLAIRVGITGYARARSNLAYDFTGATAQVRIVETIPNDHAEMFLAVVNEADTSCYIAVDYEDADLTELSMACELGGNELGRLAIDFDPLAHRYVRMQHVAAPVPHVAFSTSPDAESWVPRHAIDLTVPVTSMRLELGAGTFDPNAEPTGIARFDDFALCR